MGTFAVQEKNRAIFYLKSHLSLAFYVLHCLPEITVPGPSCVWLLATPWTVAHQAPLSMGFSQQEYWSGLLVPPPEGLPNPGIKPTSSASPALAGGFFTTLPPGKPHYASVITVPSLCWAVMIDPARSVKYMVSCISKVLQQLALKIPSLCALTFPQHLCRTTGPHHHSLLLIHLQTVTHASLSITFLTTIH